MACDHFAGFCFAVFAAFFVTVCFTVQCQWDVMGRILCTYHPSCTVILSVDAVPKQWTVSSHRGIGSGLGEVLLAWQWHWFQVPYRMQQVSQSGQSRSLQCGPQVLKRWVVIGSSLKCTHIYCQWSTSFIWCLETRVTDLVLLSIWKILLSSLLVALATLILQSCLNALPTLYEGSVSPWAPSLLIWRTSWWSDTLYLSITLAVQVTCRIWPMIKLISFSCPSIINSLHLVVICSMGIYLSWVIVYLIINLKRPTTEW